MTYLSNKKIYLFTLAALLMLTTFLPIAKSEANPTTLTIDGVNIVMNESGAYLLNFDSSIPASSEITLSEKNSKESTTQVINQPGVSHSYELSSVTTGKLYTLLISANAGGQTKRRTIYFDSDQPSVLIEPLQEVGGSINNDHIIMPMANQGSESEPNNSFATADTATEAVDYSGLINPLGDLDYYKISINANGGGRLNVFVGSIPSGRDYDLYVYNGSQSLVGLSLNSSNSDELVTHNISSGGTYTFYAVVTGYGNSYHATDSYLFRWRFYPDWVWPTPGSNRITSSFGPRAGGHHDGTDIGRYSSSTSTLNWDYEILATRSGTVNHVSPSATTDSCGWWVQIDHGTISGEKVETRYCHLESKPLVNKDASVSAGQRIGWMGNTGTSSGKHLHFGGRFGGTTFRNMENYLTRPGIDVIDDYWDRHPHYQ